MLTYTWEWLRTLITEVTRQIYDQTCLDTQGRGGKLRTAHML